MTKYHVIDKQVCTVSWRIPVEADDEDAAYEKYSAGDHGLPIGPEIGDAHEGFDFYFEIEEAPPAAADSGAPPNAADSERAARVESALVGLLACINKHVAGDKQDLDAVASDIISAFDLRDAVAESQSGIAVGGIYRFDYPQHFQTLPDYTARIGQTVKVLRVLSDDEADPECFPMFEVEAADGWRGSAYPDELAGIDAPAETHAA